MKNQSNVNVIIKVGKRTAHVEIGAPMALIFENKKIELHFSSAADFFGVLSYLTEDNTHKATFKVYGRIFYADGKWFAGRGRKAENVKSMTAGGLCLKVQCPGSDSELMRSIK